MFSAYEMTTLAESYFYPDIKAETWDAPWDVSFLQKLLKVLLSGGLSLVAYDVDKNHEPCLAGGKKAHWAAIKGFIIPITSEGQLQTLERMSNNDTTIKKLKINTGLPFFWMEPSQSSSLSFLVSEFADSLTPSQLRLITQQSKSKYQAIWTFESLQQSNDNLSQFDEDRITSPEFKVPDVLDTLRGKFVFLESATQSSA